ncbi:MAG: sulfatase [Proteobacteria bacterium]|nr:sulfatase [Pseudomonadota bacterium]
MLITVDTLRADHLGIYGYSRPTSPRIDRWFARAAIFERAYATDSNTPPSVVSILSGRLPQEHGVRIFYQLLPRETALLPDLLPDVYQSAAFVSNLVLTDEALGLAERFDHYDDFVSRRESSRLYFERSARETSDAAIRWLETGRDPDRPLFLWVHFIDPHGPYRPPADAETRFAHEGSRDIDPRRVKRYMREPGVTDGLVYVDRYDEEIAYMDVHVGRLLDAIPRSEEALVVFTADHGESLMEHERWFAHGHQVYEGLMRVPLLIRGPGVRGGRRRHPVSTVDVVPTLLGFAETRAPRALRGLDLLATGAQDPDRVIFSEAFDEVVQWRSALQGWRKWTGRFQPGSRVPDQQRFYDLSSDPDELAPGDWEGGGAGARALLDLANGDPDPGGVPVEFRRGRKLDAPKISPRADEDATERLRALGYVE